MMKTVNEKNRVIVFAAIAVLLLGNLLMAGNSKKGYLGVSIEKLGKEGKQEHNVTHGVLILDVVSKSPAEKAGLKEDDIILFFGKDKIRTPDDLVEAVRNTEPGTEVTLKIVRDGKEKTISASIGKYKTGSHFSFNTGDSNVLFYAGGSGIYLGVRIQEMNEDLAGYFGVKADEGLLILEVEEDSPAEGAGMKSGDVIVEIDGDPVEDADDIHDILEGFEEGETVDVTVIRKKRKQSFKVELEETEGWNRIGIFGSHPAAIMEGRISRLRAMPHFRSRIHIDEDDIKHFYERHGDHLEDILEEHNEDLDALLEDLNKHIEKNVKFDIEEKLHRNHREESYPVHGTAMI